jgi:hypothetical protein
MSVLLEKPIENIRTIAQVAMAPRREQESFTEVHITSIPVTRTRSSRIALVDVLAKACLFGAVAAVAFSTLSLVGHVKLEAARQQRLDAVRRASDARAAVSLLSRQLDRQTSPDGIDRWAADHGFQSADALDNAQLVAKH